MNPNTNKFEELQPATKEQMRQLRDLEDRFKLMQAESQLVRPDGTPVPKHWTVLTVGQHVVVENYTFEVAHIGESHLLLTPVGIPGIRR